jgi:hypothetical protein
VQDADATLSKIVSKTDDTDALSELEHWYTILLQFQRHPLTVEYIKNTAGILGIKYVDLKNALIQSEQETRKAGDALKAKSSK